jgi:hypothetical protein
MQVHVGEKIQCRRNKKATDNLSLKELCKASITSALRQTYKRILTKIAVFRAAATRQSYEFYKCRKVVAT